MEKDLELEFGGVSFAHAGLELNPSATGAPADVFGHGYVGSTDTGYPNSSAYPESPEIHAEFDASLPQSESYVHNNEADGTNSTGVEGRRRTTDPADSNGPQDGDIPDTLPDPVTTQDSLDIPDDNADLNTSHDSHELFVDISRYLGSPLDVDEDGDELTDNLR